mmetsp:Transcript_21603/g.64758  ORF Transcript_21603/g.64758 Transcript_21603/m.64758 type:complete len:203 (-) Transcript_21603:367-975(-)
MARVRAQLNGASAHVHTLCKQLVPLHDAGVAANVFHQHIRGRPHARGADGAAAAHRWHCRVCGCGPVSRRRVGRGRAASAGAQNRADDRVPGAVGHPAGRVHTGGRVASRPAGRMHHAVARSQQLQPCRAVLHASGPVAAVCVGNAQPDQHGGRHSRYRGCHDGGLAVRLDVQLGVRAFHPQCWLHVDRCCSLCSCDAARPG